MQNLSLLKFFNMNVKLLIQTTNFYNNFYSKPFFQHIFPSFMHAKYQLKIRELSNDPSMYLVIFLQLFLLF